ncbi:solute carrier family 22 member 17 isoform X1 [Microcaecilia unicolor]|uniref:Solute carrier family 22 member 17 isoform X1 n=1 Tax=Microcaecilia unicolor TaxID=1415580 RepID=A0A6P7WTH5_9AMPH|nr:solute carrier family 22 member 17 isoform X1 [Microcaecilia unicolor]XP_030043714.1 solute carrier family 22 member 17 isoform X1 [Microcaecilia unicolor]
MEGGEREAGLGSLQRDLSSPSMLELSRDTVSFENLVTRIGGMGPGQRLQLALSWLPNIFVAFGLFSDVFITLTPAHHCHVDPRGLPLALQNVSGERLLNVSIPLERNAEGRMVHSQCRRYHYHENESRKETEPCRGGWEYSEHQGLRENMVTEWDLVCSQYWEVPVEEVCFIFGFLIGYLLLGYASDRMGRRRTFLVSLVSAIVCGILGAVANSSAVFILLRFLLGCLLAGLFLSLYILRLELCDPSQRLTVTMLGYFFVLGGQFLLLGITVGCKDWRVMQGVITAPLALFLLYSYPNLFLESPRWLLASLRVAEAKEVLKVLVERKGHRRFDNTPDRGDVEEVFAELENTFHSSYSTQPSTAKLFSCRNIWKNLVILGFTTLISNGIHHCYGTFRKNIQGTRSGLYFSYLLSAGTGVLACLFLCMTVDRFGRRGVLLLSMTLTGISSLILLGLIEYLNEAAILTFCVLGLFSSHAAASLSVIFTAELTPTVIRGEGVGLIMALASLGKLSSPLMDFQDRHGYFLQHVVLTSMAILCILSILLLPESKRKPLPETLKDGELYCRPSLLLHRRPRCDHMPLLSTPNPLI